MAVDTLKKDKTSNWKSRKLWLFFLIYGISVSMVLIQFAQFDQWSEFVNWLYGIYATSNVGTSLLKDKQGSKKRSKKIV
jgi:hypothetical protein